MKKLLSLLSILTISGTTMPMVIAAAPYQQKNNLETLKRNKRQNNNIFTTGTLNFDFDVKEYFKNLCKVIKDLLEKGIILNVKDSLSGNETVCNSNYFSVNSNSNYRYFIIPILFEGRNIQLVFRSSDFYLEGVSVVTNNEVPLNLYYHFSDSTITELSGYSSRSFGFSGNYNNLMPMPSSGEALVRWNNNITQAFSDIINYGDNPSSSGNVSAIRGALARVILATSESIRFRVVRNSIINYNPTEATWSFFHNHITNWDNLTNQSIAYVDQHGTLNGFLAAATILMFSGRMDAHLNSCNRKQVRDLNSNDKYCFTIPTKELYFNSEHKKEIFENVWEKDKNNIFPKQYDFYLGDINPTIFKKIYIIGDNDTYTKASWGNDAYYGKSISNVFSEKNNNFKDIIDQNYFVLQSEHIVAPSGAYFIPSQYIWISYYKENDKDYYLSLTLNQRVNHASTWVSVAGAIWNIFGKGIKLS